MSFRFSARLLFLVFLDLSVVSFAQSVARQIPKQVPPRRSTQLVDGFGMNVDLPREPRLPWTRRWWTRLFDSGVKWVRIGQYENSSEKTSWDWVEQTPGNYAVSPEVDEAIRSLVENGVTVEIELQYSNPLYQGDPASRPTHVMLPPVGIGENDSPPNPIFIPPTTDEQIEAFLKYTHFMVGHFRDHVKYWELWNEPNIGYWQPTPDIAHGTEKEQLVAKAQQYGHLLGRFADAVHETDPEAKVMSAGTAGPDLVFARAAIADCASKIDVVAYHTYPGFGENHMPEEADTYDHAAFFREQLLHLPGMRNDVEFWLNEWNVSPRWKNSNETVQARYVPRFYLYNLAQHVRGAMWVFVPSTEGNEDDLFGILHGETFAADSFAPREAYHSFQVTSALFGQTTPDPMAEFRFAGVPAQYEHGQLQSYAFRDKVSSRCIYAFWLAVNSDPADSFAPVEVDLEISDLAIQTPVLVDVRTGRVKALTWKSKGIVRVPLKDSVVAVADAAYLDWPEVPETPGELRATRSGSATTLAWKTYGEASRVEIERSVDFGPWQRAGEGEGGKAEFRDSQRAAGHLSYKVRALGKNGPSAWSSPAWIELGP
jgi:hypothetical protein